MWQGSQDSNLQPMVLETVNLSHNPLFSKQKTLNPDKHRGWVANFCDNIITGTAFMINLIVLKDDEF